MPEGMTSVGADSFDNCSALEAVYLPSTLTNVSKDSFDNSTQQILFMCKPSSYAYNTLVSQGAMCFNPTDIFKSLQITSFNLNPIYKYSDTIDFSSIECNLIDNNDDSYQVPFHARLDSAGTAHKNNYILSFEYLGFVVKYETYILPEETTFKYGDINNSDTLTLSDASYLLKALVGSVTITEDQKAKGDLSGDSNISLKDASLLLQLLIY